MIQPNIFNDVDGQYRGHERRFTTSRRCVSSPAARAPLRVNRGACNAQYGHRRVRRTSATRSRRRGVRDQYTVFSLWDTFRAAHPLYTIIEQKRTADFINTFIRQYEQGGRLPVWELAGERDGHMIGYHAVSVIADAMAKGHQGL